MRRIVAFVSAWLACVPAIADIVSEEARDVEVTVYRPQRDASEELNLDEESDGIAMVTETRTIEIPRGTSVLRFRGVADAIVPQTAKLEGIAATVVESNFDYNLLTPGTLLANSLGRPVRLVRTNPATGEVTERRGTLRSGPDGVLVDFDGAIEALRCSGLNERLVFDDVPETLTDTPTLSMVVRAPEAGRFDVRLSYLAMGLDWSADYVARIHPDGKRLDLSAWITLVNRHRTQFTDAKTHVVGGNLARDEDTRAPEAEVPKQQDRCWPIGEFRSLQRARIFGGAYPMSAPALRMVSPADALESVVVTGSYVARVSELGDYKLYSLPLPTTIAPSQMKQVRLLSQTDVRFERLYLYRFQEGIDQAERENDRPRALLRLENKKRDGLGIALPAGRLALMENDERGRRILAGENTIDDTPVGLPFDIEYAKAMDVWVSPRVIEDDIDRTGVRPIVRRTVEIQVGNDKPTAITLEIVHQPENLEDFRIVKESRRHAMKFGRPLWSLRLRPGQREVLRYTVEHRR